MLLKCFSPRGVKVILVNYEELDYLFSRNAISKLSKNPKKIYKNGLVAMFITALMVGDFNKKKKEYADNIGFCHSVLDNPRIFQNVETFKVVDDMVQAKLQLVFVKNPKSDATINKIIEMMREIIKANLNGDRYLLTFEELEHLLDVKALLNLLFRNSNPNISHHHWIEFDLERSIVHTFPDFITYADLISLWNIYIDKRELLHQQKGLQSDRILIRVIDSEIHALHISLWTQAVTVVESYLYYIFYNIKMSNYPLNSTKAQGFINVAKPDDNQILDSLILPEFSSQENEGNISIIKQLHQQYKSINNIRNRFIHASAFDDNKQSHLLPLVTSNSSKLLNALELCTDLVLEIEKILPTNLKILFWWDSMQHPNYKKYIKGNYINRTDI